ncbi:MAG: class I tRNA ligase family protein [Thermoplasmata archaeon]|nr:class I tRNA ligase family protein [Thermoplasmata archaeon]MCI4341976.1 class I tRNA ligase family protein [Thermoplasmata archaeon]
MPFRLRDSLTGRRRTLAPADGKTFTMYICGPTVYDAAHVGHGRTYLYFDVLRRALEERGTRVRHVMNITDYEEKISYRAESLGLTWRALARRETARFHADLDRLRILRPHCEPKASAFVPPMIEVGRRLAHKGRVVSRADSWVWVPPPPSHRNFPVGDELTEHLVQEAGVAPPSADTAREIELWRRAEGPLPRWIGPWGVGAPGWHLECYAMASRYLGVPVDLMGGGIDLLFPHHYAGNEIALALDGTLCARQFLHLGFVTQLHRKMSKSRGNLVPLRAATLEHGPDALRWFLLGRPYNSRIEWVQGEVERAAQEWMAVRASLRAAVANGGGGTFAAEPVERLGEEVLACVEDGFHVETALEHIGALAREMDASPHGKVPRGSRRRAIASYRQVERVLGLRIL